MAYIFKHIEIYLNDTVLQQVRAETIREDDWGPKNKATGKWGKQVSG